MIIHVNYEKRSYGNEYPADALACSFGGGPRWMPNSISITYRFATPRSGISANGGMVTGAHMHLSRDHAVQLAEALLEYARGERKAFSIALA
jgi:hypothetical protein